MALHYYRGFQTLYKSLNFGDDINPWFLSQLFKPEIIESNNICLIGIGTILNDQNAATVAHFDRKVVFSSGVGYGAVTSLDESWDFVCVRGPRSAKILGLAPEIGICDGAILLANLYPAVPTRLRKGVVFIPHVHTAWNCGSGLQAICRDLSIRYLAPDVTFTEFIEVIQSASLVVTEAMHGAILADSLRTPWIPIEILNHHEFKWQDWFGSVELPYQCETIRPVLWNKGSCNSVSVKGFAKGAYRQIKQVQVKYSLRRLINDTSPLLSRDEVLLDRKNRLMDCVSYINDTY